MGRVGWVYSDEYLRHESDGYHPERPDRLRAALDGLTAADLVSKLVAIEPRTASVEELALAHTPEHVEHVRATCAAGKEGLDPDTYVNEGSFDIARLAAGGVLSLVDALVEGSVDYGMAWIRPPGHHASADRAMGFCLFNNVAVAARYAQEKHGLSRLLIVDWDAHHGNGTQAIFWRDPTVAYFSIHQFPFYPGTGAAKEEGQAEGVGFTVNSPQPEGAGDAEFNAALEEVLVPLWERSNPQMIIVSAGFDAHARDPLAQLTVSTAGFSTMARWILERAGSHPVAFVLEGGYDETALSECTVETARACLEMQPS